MITVEQKNANEIKFMELLAKLDIDLTAFNKFLEQIGYFDAPFTSQYNGAYPGGLCEHALAVAHELGVLCNAYYPGRYSPADVLTVALLKDIYRATIYEAYMKNVKDADSGQWTSIPAYRTVEADSRPVYGDLGLASFFQIKQYITSLTDEQTLAIIHAKPTDFTGDIHEVMRTYPLVALTRMAEMAATYF